MTAPKRRLPGQVVEITRTTTQRQFLLRPGHGIRELSGYMYGKAADDHGQVPHVASMLSNHTHLFQTDESGRRDRFMQQFFSNTTRKQNLVLDRRENIWAVGEPGDNLALGLIDVITRTVYTALQPVAAGLVKHAHEWTGFQILPRDWGKVLTFERPDGCGAQMPETVEIRPVPPPGFQHLPLDQVIAFFEDVIARKEREIAKRRRGRPVVGVEACEAMSPYRTPSTPRPMRQRKPHFTSRDKVRAARAIQALKQFKADHEQSRRQFLDCDRGVVFPCGTLQMVDRSGVTAAPIQPNDPHITDINWNAAVQEQWDDWRATAA